MNPPGRQRRVLKTAQTAGLTAAVTMVSATAAISDSPVEFVENIFSLGQWICEHPIPALLVFVILVSLIIKFPDIVVNILLWLPRAAWRVLKWIWRAFRKN